MLCDKIGSDHRHRETGKKYPSSKHTNTMWFLQKSLAYDNYRIRKRRYVTTSSIMMLKPQQLPILYLQRQGMIQRKTK